MTSLRAEPISDRRWSLFTVTWAAAVLFHLAGNTRLAPWWTQALIGASAVAVLLRPAMRWPSLALAVTVLVGIWEEAPILANHWLLHGLLALIVLGTLADPTRREPSGWFARLVGPARLTLLGFYSFAAFAKLNTDFFEPVVSCATFYLDESAASWGLDGLLPGLSGGVGLAVAVAVASIELSVPVLLFVRRTRVVGVLVALVFHFVLALDRSHQFFDFSSILLCLFLLFLPDDVVGSGLDRLESARRWLGHRWESGPELLHLGLVAAAGVAVVTIAGPRTWPAPRVMRDVGLGVWFAMGIGTTVVVALAARSSADRSDPGPVLTSRSWLLVVPVLAVLNGLTPYLEVKTGTSWNMYSNLAVVDGDSNHLLVRSGLPLTDGHERLVRVLETNDGPLGFYVDSPWRLPAVQFDDYLAERPGAWATVEESGQEYRVEGGGSGRPEWRQKFQIFRAVDVDGPTACQPAFGPAR